MITRSDIASASRRIQGHVRHTPILLVERGVFGAYESVALKLENFQVGGSFKTRGVFNLILAKMDRSEIADAGIITALGRNATIAVAHAARKLGIHARACLPSTIPAAQVAELENLGVETIVGGNDHAEAFQAAVMKSIESGAYLVPALDQPEIVAGHGTVGLELSEQISGGVNSVLVPVGGGGLIAGICVAMDPSVRIVSVEPITCPTMRAALNASSPVDVEVSGVTADTLGVQRLGSLPFEVATKYDIQSVLVTDEAIVWARRTVWKECQMMIEHAAAVPIAALLTRAYVPRPRERVAVVICGANTNRDDLLIPPSPFQ